MPVVVNGAVTDFGETMIYIGNQTAKFACPVHMPFAYAAVRGFTAFEWFADTGKNAEGATYGWTFARIDSAGRERLRVLAREKRFSVHAPWDADPRTSAGRDALRETLRFAEEISAPTVVAHLCPESSAIHAFAEALGELLLAGDFAGNAPCVAVENTVHNSPADFHAFAEALPASLLSAGRVGMTFDLGHANCCDATRNDYIRFLNELPAALPIVHCHVHENWGDGDTHLPLFTGPAANNDAGIRMFAEILIKRGFAGSLILEQWPEPPELLDKAAGRLAEIFRGLGAEVAEFRPAEIPAVTDGDAWDWTAGEVPVAAITEPLPDVPGNTGNDALVPEPEISPESSAGAPEVNPAPRAENAAPLSVSVQNIPFACPQNPNTRNCPPDAFVTEAAAAMRRHTSWRTRLEWVRDCLEKADCPLTAGRLAILAALLRFLATGELTCAEDGGHYRPNHHASAGAAIEDALEKSDAAEWLKRRIYPFLPSHAGMYRVGEPLTRIRDIAHRNDIPKDLKLRIKHDLQNKLHRSAGPEDLRTAREIFAQITAPGASYSRDFVEQFRIFMGELERFFNAPDLGARLNAVADAVPKLKELCARMRNICQSSRPAEEQAAAAVTLRQALAEALAEATPENRQVLRLADIELENLVFARLSAAIGDDSREDGQLSALDGEWFALMETALVNAALSESDDPEMATVAAEFAAWHAEFIKRKTLDGVWGNARLRATMQRVIRCGAAYQEKIAGILVPAATALGRALNIDARALAVFGEGAVRAGVLFQPVKLAETADARLRADLHLPPWGVIVPGTATGVALDCDDLDDCPADLPGKAGDFAAIVRLTHADGDEEIPAWIKGIILAHPLPQLSHLAIRARQAGVVMAAAENVEDFADLAVPPGGDFVTFEHVERAVTLTLRVTAEGITLVRGAENSGSAPVMARKSSAEVSCRPAPIVLATAPQVLAEAAITRGNGGAKAEGAAWLRSRAAVSRTGAGEKFSAPAAVALPFGSMEYALQAAGRQTEYARAVAAFEKAAGEEISGCLENLRRIIMGVEIPVAVLEKLRELFPAAFVTATGARFAVRSSSNGEDLENLAGAGLYDSVIGVTADALPTAIKQVWASLWTRRAALSRRAGNIPQDAVKMAVLIQEALAPDYSFVLHTADPVTGERGTVGMEIAVGLGETLASANQSGRPYHVVAPVNGGLRLLSCADYSFAARGGQNAGDGAQGQLRLERVNYAEIPLSRDSGAWEELALRLADIGRNLEKAAGRPLDIEGAVCGDKIWIVQARPEVGLAD